MFIINSQEAIIDLMVNQVFKKHGVKKELDMSVDDKSKLKEIVDQLQSDVDKFVENEKVAYTENNVGVNSLSENADTPSVKQTNQVLNQNNNDVKTIKNFVYRKKKWRK
ncbi:hypothetical protein CR203_15680 [Salipaludibacillus neizhouensis]|uniref:Spore coat protein n=1 Tax=Salipaludibacillus neizhouensis TaxID=885475 RepID=A0A3A9K639_9BACI|nr:hypothetical protein [Salipaludibacillus neizhouensis]RKL66330.1 hypothetical protein CR203_15680 [Salipaludibacillus neizhouensis]